MSRKLNTIGRQLSTQLTAAKAEKANEHNGQLVNVAGVGGVVSAAYEQLRNATEYTQENLLRQKAIRRFYVRNLSFQSNTVVDRVIAEELIIELTQSGYIVNDTQPIEVIDKLKNAIQKHYGNYWRFKGSNVKNNQAQDWTLDLLSVESEKLITQDLTQTIYVQFAYQHYFAILPKKSFIADKSEDVNYEASLYVAVHRALFKSDVANVRYDMQQLYKISDKNISEYSHFHENIDTIFSSGLTDKITRHINKYGAPLRVLRSMVKDNNEVDRLLADSDRFRVAYATQIEQEYDEAKARLNKGLIKSIVFLLITKALIGIAIEVPYDLLVTGTIIVFPLTVNLLVPVVYMALLRLGLKLPGEVNAKAMQLYADNMLYGDQNQVNLYPITKKKRYSVGFTIAYVLMFFIVFGLVISQLVNLGFNIVQGVIFFIFFATASFLGFRLSRTVRELELITAKPGLLTATRDFLYMPFILLGQWLSDKYQKVNIVALILDTVIELPLKTVLRLMRQWMGFINEKKDEI